MVEQKVVVRDGYEEIFNLAKAKLENLEAEAKAKVEEMIREDKLALEDIIAQSTKIVEIEIEDNVDESTDTTGDVVGE